MLSLLFVLLTAPLGPVVLGASWPCFAVPSHSAYSYCISLPQKYDKNNAYPTLTFLSGSGARGSLGLAPIVSKYSGVGHLLDGELNGKSSVAGNLVHKSFLTIFIVAPTTTSVFDPNAVISALKAAQKRYKTDSNRAYLTGYSMGCRGVLRTLVYKGSAFAAGLCSSGYAEAAGDHYITSQKASPDFNQLNKIKGIPLWFYASKSDETNAYALTKNTADKIDSKCNRFTTLSALSHSQMADIQFTNPQAYTWLLTHSRSGSGQCRLIKKSGKRMR